MSMMMTIRNESSDNFSPIVPHNRLLLIMEVSRKRNRLHSDFNPDELAEARRKENDARPEAYMFRPNHDHEKVRSEIRNIQGVRHAVLASVAMGCIECADIIIEHCDVPLSVLLFVNECLSGYRREVLAYYVKRCNERTQLPFLLAFAQNSTQNSILKHSLYTRDVLRAILMLAAFKIPPLNELSSPLFE
jgi:hypothetical protein